MPYNDTVFSYPEGVTETGDTLCKRLNVTPNSTTSSCSGSSTSTSIITNSETTPNPNPDPDPGGNGNSKFASCLSEECGTGTGGPAPPDYRWKYTFYNTSGNPANIVKSCTWDWEMNQFNLVQSSDACLDKQYLSHIRF
jgi:hypothetical protein